MTGVSSPAAMQSTRLETGAGAQPRRLPIPTRLRPGDTAAEYVTRLAAANHLPLAYLRGYLRPSGRFSTTVDLERLAAISGYDPEVLLRAFTAPRCLNCGAVLPGRKREGSVTWCSATCRQAAADSRRPKPWAEQTTWSTSRCATCFAEMIRPYWEPFCSAQCRKAAPAGESRCRKCGGQIERPAVGRPAIWCSPRCRRAGYESRRRGRTTNRHRDWHLVITRTSPTP